MALFGSFLSNTETTDQSFKDSFGIPGGSTLYAPGSVIIATGNFRLHVKRLQLTTTQRLSVAGTGRLRLTN